MSSASDYTNESRASGAWIRAKAAYFYLLVVLTLTIALASFIRVRGQGLSNISLWIFVVPFALTLVRTRLGLIAAVLLLTMAPALHLQLNAVAGTRLYAWAYPGVDACLGFLFAWVCKGQMTTGRGVLARFPVGPLLLFHVWIALSALVAVARNLWQSASEFSVRGLAYNIWLTRGISWLDDYYPLQDLFFYSAGLAMLFAVWAMLARHGFGLLRQITLAVLTGALMSAVFAIWQRATGLGWSDGDISLSVNALWPDLHSFGAFMALAVFLGYGVTRTQSIGRASKIAVLIAVVICAVGLFLSTSRATLILTLIAMVLWAGWAVLRLRSWYRALPLAAIAAVAIALEWALEGGYRGYTFAVLRSMFEAADAESVNAVLSHRPEIWSAAIDMYLAFPQFGLGQGSFYRLSGLADFSPSEALRSLGGSSAHNYFLHTFVELGPVAAILALLIAVPFAKLGKLNFNLISFYALLGIAIGNIYAHSLLVREMLMVCAIFSGAYFWETAALGPDRWRPPTLATTRNVLVFAAALVFLSFVEVAYSFDRVPFTYGRLCFADAQAQFNDGWAGGRRRLPIPQNAVGLEVSLTADRPDLERRPLSVEFVVTTDNKMVLASRQLKLSRRTEVTQTVAIDLPEVGSTRFLDVIASHCFVPLNLGLTYDPRRLGLVVQEVRFRMNDGVQIH